MLHFSPSRQHRLSALIAATRLLNQGNKMRIQVQTAFTTMVSEKITGTTIQKLDDQVSQAMKTSSILCFNKEDGSLVIIAPQLLVNSIVTILKD